MQSRFFLPFVAALFLCACVAAVPEEGPSASGFSASAVAGTNTDAPAVASAPHPEAGTVAEVSPARETHEVSRPEGSTGLPEARSEALEYSDGCFSGEGGASPPAAPIDPSPRGWVSQLPARYEAIPFAEDTSLKSALDAALGDKAEVYAYYVKELSTGRGAVHNGDDVFNAASLFKLFVMYSVFHQESLGLIEWSDRLVITPYYAGFALAPTEVCKVITVAEAMEAMLSLSDNVAAVLLQDLAGSSNVNAAITALGLTESGLFVEGLPVTANDLAVLMEAIATGNAISPEASADMLRLLDHDIFENGLMNGLPPGTQASRKTGNWSDATHVAGVVYAPSGPYVFVALTSNAYETSIIQALSSAAYEYFEASRAQAGR